VRIAFFLGVFPCLSETFILNQITGLIDRGHEVDIYAQELGAPDQAHQDVLDYRLMERCHFPDAVDGSLPRRLLHRFALLVRHGWRRPAMTLRSLDPFRYGTKALSLTIFHRCLPFLRARPYDVFHCHYGNFGLMGAQLQAVGAATGRLVTTFYGFDLTATIKQQGPRVYDELWRSGSLCLPIASHWCALLAQLGCDPRKIVLHRIGVSCRKFRFIEPERRPQGDPLRVLTIARLVGKKGLSDAVAAIAECVKTIPSLRYEIIGDGPLRGALETQIHALGLDGTVHLLGWRKQDEILRHLEESHLLLQPSVTAWNGDGEGTPTVIMEAAATGLPVVGTRHSGIPDIVVDGQTGYLVAEHDVPALAARIVELARRPELRAEMGRAGRRHIETHFDVDGLNDDLVRLYQDLVAGKFEGPPR
jgi:colanic acid/amylovoran biosynthesis glycosyltransferase